MIRWFLFTLLALTGCWYIADTIKEKGQGYAYIYFDHYSVETSFWVLLASLIIIVFALYWGMRLSIYAIRLGVRAVVLPKSLGVKKSRKFHQTAILAYLEQYWFKAHSDMSKALKKVETPFIANLVILQSHLNNGDIGAAQSSYKAAESCSDYDAVSLMLAHIDILVAQSELKEAENFCIKLLREYPSEMRVVLKTLRIYQRLGNPVAMQPFMKAAKKHNLLTTLETRQWQQDYYQQLFTEKQQSNDWSGLKKVWRAAYKLHDHVVTQAFYHSAELLAPAAELEKLLRKQLEKQFFPRLCPIYARLDVDVAEQLAFLQSLLANHGESVELLNALAVLYHKDQQVDKAVSCLDKSLNIQLNAEAYKSLADLYSEQGDTARQIDNLQKALSLHQTQ